MFLCRQRLLMGGPCTLECDITLPPHMTASRFVIPKLHAVFLTRAGKARYQAGQ
jgi:hypothetical protein